MTKYCKNKKCGKKLPDDFKGKYCERCRNKQSTNVKNGATIAGCLVGLFCFFKGKK